MYRYFLFLGLLISVTLNAQMQVSTPSTSSPPLNEQEALKQTLDFARSHQEFKELNFKQHEAEFVRLVEEGQSPQTLFIGCSDSRVVPELILNMRPGDLFVIRNAGNFVPPANFQEVDGVAATLQFAVDSLNVRHIIVCGHSHCGAIRGLYQQLDPTQFGLLKRWIQLGEQAKKLALQTTKPTLPREDLYVLTEKLSVLYQLEHLMSYPFVAKRVAEGKLELHGWYFDIETANIWYYDPALYQFKPLIIKKKS